MRKISDIVMRVRVDDKAIDQHETKLRKVTERIQKLGPAQDVLAASSRKMDLAIKRLQASHAKNNITTETYNVRMDEMKAKKARLINTINMNDAALKRLKATEQDLTNNRDKHIQSIQEADSRYSKFIGTVTKVAIVVAAAKRVFSNMQDAAKRVDMERTLNIQVEGFTEKMAEARKQTGGLVTDLQLTKSAALMSSFGIPMENFGETIGIIGKLAVRTGQDVNFLTDSYARGISRLSPLILDNLGIQVSLTEAYDAYGAKVGKAGSALSDFEKRVALSNQVLEKAKVLVADIDLDSALSTPLNRVTTAWANFQDSFAEGLVRIVDTNIRGWDLLFSSTARGLVPLKAKVRELGEDLGRLEVARKKAAGVGEDTSFYDKKIAWLTREQWNVRALRDTYEDLYITQNRLNNESADVSRTDSGVAQRLMETNQKSHEIIIATNRAWHAHDKIVSRIKAANEDIVSIEAKAAMIAEARRMTENIILGLRERSLQMSAEELQQRVAFANFNKMFLEWAETSYTFYEDRAEKERAFRELVRGTLDTTQAITKAHEDNLLFMQDASEATMELTAHQKAYTETLRAAEKAWEELNKEATAARVEQMSWYNDMLQSLSQLIQNARTRVNLEKQLQNVTSGVRAEYFLMDETARKAARRRLQEIATEAQARKHLVMVIQEQLTALVGGDFARAAELAETNKRISEHIERLEELDKTLGRSGGRAPRTKAPKRDRDLEDELKDWMSRRLYFWPREADAKGFWDGIGQRVIEQADELDRKGIRYAFIEQAREIFNKEKLGEGFMKEGTSFWDFMAGDTAHGMKMDAFIKSYEDLQKKVFKSLGESMFLINPEVKKFYEQLKEIREEMLAIAKGFDGVAKGFASFAEGAAYTETISQQWIKNLNDLAAGADTFATALKGEADAHGLVLAGMPLLRAATKSIIKDRQALAAVEMLMQAAAAWAAFGTGNWGAAAAHTIAATTYGLVASGAIALPKGKGKKEKADSAASGGGERKGDVHVHIHGPVMQTEADHGVLIHRALQQARAEGAI